MPLLKSDPISPLENVGDGVVVMVVGSGGEWRWGEVEEGAGPVVGDRRGSR